MVEDAEANAAADKEKSEQIELKTNLKLFVTKQKQLEQLEATCSAEEKQKIENLVTELEEAVKKKTMLQ